MSDPATRKVAIVGAGLIGASWAALFSRAGGHDVAVWDPVDGARASFEIRFNAACHQLAALSFTKSGPVRTVETLEAALSDAGWVQENGPEDLAVKRELYREIEALAAPSAVIASSTSAFCWSELTESMVRPERFVTAHPFNPPHLIPLVELFGHDQAVVADAEAFLRAMGRSPVVLRKESVGHIANRLSSALWREAVAIVADGVATVADVDAALVNGPGLRWAVVGSHLTYHLGGGEEGLEGYLCRLGPSQERRWASLGTPDLGPQVQKMLVAGMAEAVGGRSTAELAGARDAALIAILNAKRSTEAATLTSIIDGPFPSVTNI